MHKQRTLRINLSEKDDYSSSEQTERNVNLVESSRAFAPR